VVRLYYHTPGGVIESGKPIMEILPSDVPLIIEAQVLRTEIDSVKVGQEATVRLTALNQRTTPVLNGEVYYVSADSLPDAANNGAREVYLARVSLPVRELSRVPGFAPTPGMPAEILIQTAERTFFDYLTKPIRDSMARAFMER
jgi:HlyD family type I secretion membrane fusion protein